MSVFSAITGMDASHNAAVAQQENTALQQQYLDLVRQQQNLANQYQGEAANDYRDMRNTGAGQYQQSLAALINLLGQYGAATGVSVPTISATPGAGVAPTPYSAPASAGGNANLTKYPAGALGIPASSGGQTYGSAAERNTAAGKLNAQQNAQGAAPGQRMPTSGWNNPALDRSLPPSAPTSPGPSGAAQASPASDPYALTQAQHEQLNQQIDRVNQAKVNAIAEYRADAARRGVAPMPAMEQYIAQQADAQAQQLVSSFAESARATREKASANLIDLFNSLQGQGVNQQQSGTAGIANLGANAMGVAGNATANIAGNAQNQANLSQQYSNQSNADLLKLIAFFAGGA